MVADELYLFQANLDIIEKDNTDACLGSWVRRCNGFSSRATASKAAWRPPGARRFRLTVCPFRSSLDFTDNFAVTSLLHCQFKKIGFPYSKVVIQAITTVFGNVNVRQATKNVSRILSELGVEKSAMPAVYEGAIYYHSDVYSTQAEVQCFVWNLVRA